MKLNWFSFKNWNIAVKRADKIRHISAKHGGSIVASPPDVMGSNRTDGKVIPNKEFLRWSTFSWKRLMWKRFENRIALNVLQRSPRMILFYFASVQRKSRHRNDATMKSLRSTNEQFKRKTKASNLNQHFFCCLLLTDNFITTSRHVRQERTFGK